MDFIIIWKLYTLYFVAGLKWSWGCTIFGGALNKCPQNKSSICIGIQYQPFRCQNFRSTKYNAMRQNSRDFNTSKLWLTASTKRSTRRNNPKKGSKSISKRKVMKR